MNIELKYKFNYRITLVLLSAFTLFFGAIGITYRAMGIILIPLIASFLATLICIEKKRILSLLIVLILLSYEVYVSLQSYFTIIVIASFLLSLMISIFFLKGRDKSECALYATALISILIVIIAVLYLIGTYDLTDFKDIVERFLIIYEKFKSDTIEHVLAMVTNSESTEKVFSHDYLNELFDSYLNCFVAVICIIAFAIVGTALKMFSALTRAYTKEQDKINDWTFMPSSVFAYFYFVIAVLSLFATNPENSFAVSIVNLYLIFMFVFAYVGYKFISSLLKSNGRRNSTFVLLVVIVMLSSLAIQILALIGAYVCANYDNLQKNMNSNNNIFSNRR